MTLPANREECILAWMTAIVFMWGLPMNDYAELCRALARAQENLRRARFWTAIVIALNGITITLLVARFVSGCR